MKRNVTVGLVVVLAAGMLTAISSGAPTTTYRAAIYSVRSDGTGRQLIAQPDPPVSGLVRSPGGRSILFNGPAETQNDVLYASDLFGANRVRLSPPGVLAPYGLAAYSPDGGQIAFTGVTFCGFRCAGYTLYLIDRDGSGLRELASGARSPSWSPDGRELAFSDNLGVQVVDLATNETTLIASYGTGPIWAPRGKRIAYTAVRGGYGVACFVNADGSGRRCTRNHSLTRLVWSPDARQIAFRQARPRRLGIVDAEAQHLRYLGYRGRFAGPAGWSPNSRKLAYYDSSGERVVVLSLGGLARPRLIVNEQDAPVTDFRWRRKGITYVAVRREQP